MAEKVVRLQIQREAGWLYFLRDDEVWRTPIRRVGSPDGVAERIAVAGFTREPGWLYFLDSGGDVARARRSKPPVASLNEIEPANDAHEPEPQLVGPVEKVARLGLQREPGYLYFFRGAELWRTRMKRAGQAAPGGPEAERVAEGLFECEEGWHYFLDNHGDVSRVRRADGSRQPV
jgi:hypothetical protein